MQAARGTRDASSKGASRLPLLIDSGSCCIARYQDELDAYGREKLSGRSVVGDDERRFIMQLPGGPNISTIVYITKEVCVRVGQGRVALWESCKWSECVWRLCEIV